MVKAHVQKLGGHGAQAAARHLRYIERDGVEKDGSPGVLYGPQGPVARETFEQPRFGERHQFRVIVSPATSSGSSCRRKTLTISTSQTTSGS